MENKGPKKKLQKTMSRIKSIDLSKIKDLTNISSDFNGNLIMINQVKPESLPELIEENLKAHCPTGKFLPPSLAKIEDTDTRIFKSMNQMVQKGQLQAGVSDYTGETNNQLSKDFLTRGVKYTYNKGNMKQEIIGEAIPEPEPLPEGEEVAPRQMTRSEYN